MGLKLYRKDTRGAYSTLYYFNRNYNLMKNRLQFCWPIKQEAAEFWSAICLFQNRMKNGLYGTPVHFHLSVCQKAESSVICTSPVLIFPF